jgi:putative aldouronate transport system substrate-binding protein
MSNGQGRSPLSRLIRVALLALAVMIMLSACLNRQNQPLNNPKPLTVSIMVPLHQPQVPKAELVEMLKASTGVELNIAWIPNEVYTDKMINAIETNSLSQVIYVSQPDMKYVLNAIRSNVFWNIGPYLEFFPNLRHLDDQVLSEISVDEKTYGLYSEREPSRQGILIRKDWLDRLNLQEPETIEDLYEIMYQFTNNDPDGNGKKDTIGLADRNDLTFGAFKTLSSYFGTPNNWITVNDKLVPEFKTPEYINTMNYMKRLYQEGLMNRDFPVTSKQVQRYMMISGQAGVYIGSLADAPRLSDEMKKLNSGAELTLVNRISGPKGEGIWSIPSYSGMFLFSKKAIESEEELRSILSFFDRSMNPEPSNLLQYGIPDEHYTLKDGKVVINGEMSRRRNAEVLPLNTLSIAHISNPNVYRMHEQNQDPLLVKVNQLIEDNKEMLIRDPAHGLTSKTRDHMGAELAQLITNATYNYIIGQYDLEHFKKDVLEWERRGGTQMTDELNDSYAFRKIKEEQR